MMRGKQPRSIVRKFMRREIDPESKKAYYIYSTQVEKNNPGGFKAYYGPRNSVIPHDNPNLDVRYCPVALIDEYLSKIPSEYKTEAFFLSVNRNKKAKTWYKDSPMGVNTFGS